MRYDIEVHNIKCGGCASTVKKELSKHYQNVEVDLEKMPRIVTVEAPEGKESEIKAKLKSLGYPATDESLSGFDNVSTKAKSFISCATGKMENMAKK